MLKLSWIGGATDAGWFGYAPLTSIDQNPGKGIDFWIISLQVLGVASLAASFNFIVTIINMRAPGMTMMRLPLFTWMSFITAILLILAFPVITVALIELTFDRYFDFNFFNVARGGSVVLWQHLFWVFGHPEVYILILPAMGIVPPSSVGRQRRPPPRGRPLQGPPSRTRAWPLRWAGRSARPASSSRPPCGLCAPLRPRTRPPTAAPWSRGAPWPSRRRRGWRGMIHGHGRVT